MKVFLSLAFLCLFATSSFAQISGLRELMPPPKVAYLNSITDTARIYLPQSVMMLGSGYGQAQTANSLAVVRATRVFLKAFPSQFAPIAIGTTSFNGVVPSVNAFIIGVRGSSPIFDSLIDSCLTPGEKLDRSEGYLIHATPDFILLAGFDTTGLIHAATRFTELWAGDNKYLPAHILDYPDYPNRWAFSMHNLRGANAVNVMKKILDTMQRYHYNGMQQNDFKYNVLDQQPDFYFKNADTIINYSHDRGIEMIPGVAPFGYSEGILWHDRNLAEGFPANAKYIIEADTARLIPDPPVGIINGGFENVNGNGAFTGFGFYDNENGATTADQSIKHSGSQSARVIEPAKANPSGNARFSLPITTKPNKYYYLSAWVRTENVDRGEFRVLAIGNTEDVPGVSLTHTAFNVPSTTDKSKDGGWIKLGVLFNTQHHSKMNIYCGIWGGNKGTIWWDDFKIEEAGFVNILRRLGTPIGVKTSGGSPLEYGRDYFPIEDSIMLKQSVLYDFHQAPTFRRITNGKLHNGDTIMVHYYHAFTTINDVNGYGQNMVCPSEPATMKIVQKQIESVRDLHKVPGKYMLGHDEIRHLNWDASCGSRQTTPASILGENVNATSEIIKTASTGSQIYAWSDMFDSLHNAVDNFYAVNGDLRGVWDLIPKDITIVNWNSGKKAQSLDFFARHGFAQMSAPYYDQGNTINMREWRLAQQNVRDVKGMMYTTWSADYSHLRPFGYYNWGAGPYIMHKPLDSAMAAKAGPTVVAEILSDPFDAADGITRVAIHFTKRGGVMDSLELSSGAKNTFAATLPAPVAAYKLVALNVQGLKRETPTYTFGPIGNADVEAIASIDDVAVYPNPTTGELSVRDGSIVRVMSLEGVELLTASPNVRSLDVSTLSAGAYLVEVKTGSGIATLKFIRQ
jgi:hypothetical protein